MLGVFYAGLVTGWATVHVVAGLYCLEAAAKNRMRQAALPVGLFFIALAVASTVHAAHLFGHDVPIWASWIALLPCPFLLIHFVTQRLAAVTRAAWISSVFALGVLALLLMLRGRNLGELHAAVSVGMTVAIFQVAREFGLRRTAELGGLPFLGTLALGVASAFDTVMLVRTGRSTSLVLTGYGVFSLALLLSEIVLLLRKRGRLAVRAGELTARQESIELQFRELREKQAELVKKEQLAAVGELSAVIAHEVRNPLAIISNALASLKRPGLADEERQTLLDIVSEESGRLNHLVSDLLRYAKPISVEPEVVALGTLIEKAVASIGARPDVHMDVRIAKDLPPLGGDAVLLRQAFDNVVNNAVQAMPLGGALKIRVKPLPLERAISLSFKDSGEGMDTLVRKRAIDPFFTTRPAGTGLGLAIVLRVIDAHGGKLTIRSRRGSGTEILIILPLDPCHPLSNRSPTLLAPAVEPLPESKRTA